MQEVKTFLAWFDGFADNLTKAPTKAQWDKVVARIEVLRQAAASAPAMIPMNPAAFPSVPAVEPSDGNAPKHTTEFWKESVRKVLRERGLRGAEGEIEIAKLMENITVDLNRSPEDAADEVFEVIS